MSVIDKCYGYFNQLKSSILKRTIFHLVKENLSHYIDEPVRKEQLEVDCIGSVDFVEIHVNARVSIATTRHAD